jgi:pimeloyl-ACP methyl ester carboxylesterase
MNFSRCILTATLVALLLSGCSFPTNKPLAVLEYAAPTGMETSKTLLVFLRGRGGSHKNFEAYGFIESARAAGIDAKIVAPNTHMGYFMSRKFVERLKVDVIDPAKAQGYEKVWLVGVSLGGLGSIIYSKNHPEDVDGAFLIAPFVGNDPILDEVIASGGPSEWSPGEFDATDDWQREIWQWLKAYPESEATPAFHMGYGDQDRLIKGQKLLAEVIGADRVIVVEGDHKYVTFAKIWEAFLERSIIQGE